MSTLNIVSTDDFLSRIVELEATRLGFNVTISPTPLAEASVYVVDLDTCKEPTVPEGASLILLTEEDRDELSSELMSRMMACLFKPFLLDELRFALTHLPSTAQPTVFPERIPQKRLRTRREASGHRLVIDHEKKTASLSGSDPVRLSETEYKLLCLLYEHKNQPVSAKMAIPILGNAASNKYNVYICYLRRKLERGAIRLIRTVRGKGYMLQVK